MEGMLTEEKRTCGGARLHRRTVLTIGERRLMIRRKRSSAHSLPRGLRSCETLLYPKGDFKNRIYSVQAFQFFLPQILSKLEQIYFPDKSVCVALVTQTVTPLARKLLNQTLFCACNCLICTGDSQGETLAEELMEEYGIPAVFTENHTLLKQADLVLAFENPNRFIRRVNADGIVLNLSEYSTQVHYGRTVVEGVEIKPIEELYDRLPSDVDWTAFCGIYLEELQDQMQLKHPIYAKG